VLALWSAYGVRVALRVMAIDRENCPPSFFKLQQKKVVPLVFRENNKPKFTTSTSSPSPKILKNSLSAPLGGKNLSEAHG